MRVLILSNLYPPDVIGGYELGCKQAVEALRSRGHEVLVLTSAPRTPAPIEPHVARRLRLSEVWNHYMFAHSRPVTARLLQAESTLINAFNVHALCEVVEEFRPDVAYPWMLVGVGGLGLMAAIQHLGVPWLWHLMDDVPLTLCRIGGRIVEPLLREVARQLDGRFLACSSRLVEEIEAGGLKLRGRVTLVPNWVVGAAPEPRERVYDPGQTLRIMAAGQIAQHKGSDHIIEMAARLRDRGFERFSIDFYGLVDDLYFPSLVKARGLEGHIRFQGTRPQAELARLYPHYDIFAFPTWAREPFAFAPLEAMWRGCVPLMSQASGNAEWAVHGLHCLKAERNPDAFADVVGAILDGSIDLGPIARRGASVVARDFHLNALIPKIEAALAVAAARSPGRAGSSDEAYRLALLAEKLTRVLVQEEDDAKDDEDEDEDQEADSTTPPLEEADSSIEADPPDKKARMMGPKLAGSRARPEPVEPRGTPRNGTSGLL